jgi:hypothetical protein
MNITIFYYEEHLQKAVAINNSNNPYLEEPLSLERAEEELISIVSEDIEELNVVSFYGIFFLPQIISDPDEFEDIGIMMHVLQPPLFEFKDEDLKHVVLSESLKSH